MNSKFLKIITISLSIFPLIGCGGAAYHNSQIQQASEQNLSVGTVQREIKVGMSSAEVISILGSPNIVTTDEERREVWIYDKVSTQTAYSTSGIGGSILILGGSSSSGAKSTTQKTLTVIIKFNAQSKVRDFAYHTSKF